MLTTSRKGLPVFRRTKASTPLHHGKQSPLPSNGLGCLDDEQLTLRDSKALHLLDIVELKPGRRRLGIAHWSGIKLLS